MYKIFINFFDFICINQIFKSEIKIIIKNYN